MCSLLTHRLRGKADAAEQVVQHPDLGVEHDPPDQRDGDRRCGKRDDVDGLDELAALEVAVEIDRDQQPQRQLQRKARAAEIDHHLHAVPDALVAEELDEIVEADEARLPQPDGPLGEGQVEVEGDGKDHDQKQHGHRRRREDQRLAAIDEAGDGAEGVAHARGRVLAVRNRVFVRGLHKRAPVSIGPAAAGAASSHDVNRHEWRFLSRQDAAPTVSADHIRFRSPSSCPSARPPSWPPRPRPCPRSRPRSPGR